MAAGLSDTLWSMTDLAELVDFAGSKLRLRGPYRKKLAGMIRFLRIANAIFWLAAWLALAVHFNAIDNPLRMFGEAIIPAILWLAIDFLLTFFLGPSENSN